MRVLVFVGLSSESREQGYKCAPKPYHAAGNDSKIILKRKFWKYVKKEVII